MARVRTVLKVAGVIVTISALTAVLVSTGPTFARGGENDPLAVELSRWSSYVADNASTDPDWLQIKAAAEPALKRAAEALRDGRRFLALVRLSSVKENLDAHAYVTALPADSRDAAQLEREWHRMGGVLQDVLATPAGIDVASIRPAALRAVAESALAKARAYYHASLDYGRNSAPQYGLFYLGAAQAERSVVELCRRMSSSGGPAAPALRSLDPEIEALQQDLFAAYRPPASIDRHDDFIVASALLKEAGELDGLGLRYGALLKYLQAAARVPSLLGKVKPLDAAAVGARLDDFEAPRGGTAAGGPRPRPASDDSIARVLVEQARDELTSGPGGASPIAAAVVTDVLPRYAAAFRPATARAAASNGLVTVTLVRWPYT